MSSKSKKSSLSPTSMGLSEFPTSPPFPPLSTQPTFPGADILSPVSFEVDSSEINDIVSSFLTSETLDPPVEKEKEKEKEKKEEKGKKEKEGKEEKERSPSTDLKQLPESFILGRFTIGDLDGLPHYHSKNDVLCRKLLGAKLNRKIGSLSLTGPAARKGFAVFGTDTKTATEHYVVCVSGEQIKIGKNPIVDIQVRSEPIHFSLWLSDSDFVCARGKGNLETFRWNPTRRSIESTDVIQGLHTDELREVTVDPRNPEKIASVGYDCKLAITDLNLRSVQAIKLPTTGSSVKWSAFTDFSIGCTTDNGTLQLYDTRSGKFGQKYEAKKDLWTHLRYTPFNVLLGLGDGEIRHMDLRKLDIPLSLVEDPFCEGIGMIEFNQRDAVVVSGFKDFTVWKQGSSDTKIWSHASYTQLSGEDATLTYCATFLDEDTVIATNSLGYFGGWIQGFTYD